MRWVFRTLNAAVDAEIRALPADMQAKFLRFADIIEQSGFEGLPRESVRYLEGKLWELRMIGRDGISRAIYVTAAGRRVVVVRSSLRRVRKPAARTRSRPATRQGGHMTSLKDLKASLLKDPGVRKEYDALEGEFALIDAVAQARLRAGLSQAQLAKRMKTTQSTIARLESGRGRPSTRTLSRFAKATGHRLKISFEPVKAKKRSRAR
jgi:ribosome-binding protein aMBF1 (putative translation factor)